MSRQSTPRLLITLIFRLSNVRHYVGPISIWDNPLTTPSRIETGPTFRRSHENANIDHVRARYE
jgi:hypothetical protein